MANHLRVAPLGVEIEVEFDGGLSDAFRENFKNLWAEVPSAATAPNLGLRLSLGDGGRSGKPRAQGVKELRSSSETSLLAWSTAELTLEAIDYRAGSLLMVHASAVALPDGRVIAFVGNSGAGKTTIARRLGVTYGYVTDETVAIELDAEHTVLSYRKPLSIIVEGQARTQKAQMAPGELGLLSLGAEPMHLAAIVFLNRDENHSEVPTVERIALADALPWLVKQVSHLSALERPLRLLAQLFADLGGASKVTYAEADHLLDKVPDFIYGQSSTEWAEGVTESLGAAQGPGWNAGVGVEWLETAEGRLFVLQGRHLHELGGIAPAIWHTLLRSGRGVDLATIVSRVEAAYGSPSHGTARELVAQALESLRNLGLVVFNELQSGAEAHVAGDNA